MNLSQVAGIIKAILPANSPWIERIDQAAQMAKQFNPSKDGIAKLMEAQGKRKSDLQEAIKMLDHPMVKNTLGRIPGIGNLINGAANELLRDTDNGIGAKTSSFMNGNQQIPSNSFDSLQARLNRLK